VEGVMSNHSIPTPTPPPRGSGYWLWNIMTDFCFFAETSKHNLSVSELLVTQGLFGKDTLAMFACILSR